MLAGADAILYAITDLEQFVPIDMNNAGEIAGNGSVDSSDETHAFLWDGELHDLKTLGGSYVQARGINDAGDVVGWSTTATGSIHAFRWHGSEMRDLHDVNNFGESRSQAYAINATGKIAGYSHTAGGVHACVWNGSEIVDVGALVLDEGGSQAYAINDEGEVAGTVFPGGIAYAFSWNGTTVQNLGGPQAFPRSINSMGQVVGYSRTLNGFRAFKWDGAMQDLGLLPGHIQSFAYDVNKCGIIVGTLQAPSPGEGAAVIWDGGIHDLNDYLPAGSNWELLSARTINDKGQIAGLGSLDGSSVDIS